MNHRMNIGILVLLAGLLFLLLFVRQPEVSGAFFESRLPIAKETLSGQCTVSSAEDFASNIVATYYGCRRESYCGLAARDRWLPGSVSLRFGCSTLPKQREFVRACLFELRRLCSS